MCGDCHLNNQINELPKFNNYTKAELLAYGFILTLKQLPVIGMASRLTHVGTTATSAVYFNLSPAVSSSVFLQSSVVSSSLLWFLPISQ